ncbi:MAG: hypothetical protein DRG78_24475 [Epsilonproteobacteria bacterium]|nr:MAG: hypothetical protein DRG78_24475 [Campylobacterota bacterium]
MKKPVPLNTHPTMDWDDYNLLWSQMNEEQCAIEFIRCRQNPMYFIYNYVFIPEVGGSLKYSKEVVNYKTEQVIKSVFIHHKAILMASRQLGKSTVSAALLLWAATFFPGIPALILNFKKDAALENLNKIKFMNRHLPTWMRSDEKYGGERKTYIELKNNSKISSFYPSTVTSPDTMARSLTSPILYADEVAFIHRIADAFTSAAPVLFKAKEQAAARNYPFFTLMTSTPNGTVGTGEFFYQMWGNAVDSEDLFHQETNRIVEGSEHFVNDKTRNGYVKIRYHWSEDDTKDEEWYIDQKRELNFNTRAINQELDLLFVGSTTCIFDDELLAQFKHMQPKQNLILPHASQLKLFRDLDPNDYYIVGVDRAKSLTGDLCAIEIFEYSTFNQVGEYSGRLGSLTKYSEIIKAIVKHLHTIVGHRIILGIENNSIGNTVIENIENDTSDFNYVRYLYSSNPAKGRGINTNKQTKDLMVSLFYEYVNDNHSSIVSDSLINQLTIIERKANGSISAQTGAHDDLFMAAAFTAFVKKMTLMDILPLINKTQQEIEAQQNVFLDNLIMDNNPDNDSKSYIDDGFFEKEADESNNIDPSVLPLIF